MIHKSLLAALALVGAVAVGAAEATTVNGADLATTANITLPNGSGTNVGTSVQFTGAPMNQVMVDVDLDALGVGTSGTVTIETTRVSDDSDFWIGLFDGANFDATAFFDGDRIGVYSAVSTSDGATFSGGAFDGATNLPVPVLVGETATIVFAFDLVAGTTSFSVNGTVESRSFFAGFDASQPARLLIGKGSPGETLQIDSITYGATAAVPLPAGLPLMIGAFAMFGVARRRAKIDVIAANTE